MLSSGNAMAIAELQNFARLGLPISPHHARVFGLSGVQQRAPASAPDSLPSTLHQLKVPRQRGQSIQ